MRYITASQVIGATVVLMRFHGCRDCADDMAVLARAKCILDNIWTSQYRSDNSLAACEDFWLRVLALLDEHPFVSSFSAVCDETVNPPGTVGVVRLKFKAVNTAENIILKLELAP